MCGALANYGLGQRPVVAVANEASYEDYYRS